ncbi:unnamed protein product [Arctogadus glacialis]
MPRHCSAGGCKSRDNRETRKAGITFHKLPKGASRRNLWITNSHRKGLWDPQTDFVYFCSKHFTPENFELTGYSGIRRLREDAFPTVFDASLGPKRKGPGRPRKKEALHLRQKPPVTIKEDRVEAENGEDNRDPPPLKQEKAGLCAEADVFHPPACLDEATSEAQPVSLTDGCPSPPVPRESPPAECPASPSRYMRRLPPAPGFYLRREHSYAQLCPLLWRRRCERAVDCLEKALRQLSAARRRENRLRSALSRLREKRLRPAGPDDGPRARRGWLGGGRLRGAAGAQAGGDGSLWAQPEESEGEMESEEAGLGENAAEDEDVGEYCFSCNRAGDGCCDRGPRSVSRAADRGELSGARHGVARSQEEGCTWLPLLKPPGSDEDRFINGEGKALIHEHQLSAPELVVNTDHVQLMVLEAPLGDGFKTSHLQSAFKLPPSRSLLQSQAQAGLQRVLLGGESLHGAQGPDPCPALADFGAMVGQAKGAALYKEPCQQVFFVQESTEGQLLLVPATTQDRLKGVDSTDDGAGNMQTLLEPHLTFQTDLGLVPEDIPNRGLEPSNGNVLGTVVREDVREKLKEHLEGFQLQLSTEYIT